MREGWAASAVRVGWRKLGAWEGACEVCAALAALEIERPRALLLPFMPLGAGSW